MRILLILLLFSCNDLEVPNSEPEANTILNDNTRLYILAGQSGMDGRGLVQHLPVHLKQEIPNCLVWWNGSWQRLQAGVNGNGISKLRFGLLIPFAYSESLKHPKDKLYFIITSVGGSSLYGTWKEREGKAYLTMIDKYNKATEGLKLHHEAFLWYQGETDSFYQDKAEQYKENEAAFIRAVQEDTHMEKVLSVNISCPNKYNEIVRNAKIENQKIYTLTDTKELNPELKLHLDSEALITLGKMLSKKLE